MTDVKRSYRSPGRVAQAQRTRERILSAAREAFVLEGFERTTIETIAKGSSVAVQTVYAVFGSKRGLLIALADQIGEEARGLARAGEVWELADPIEQIRLLARFQRIWCQTGGDVLAMARSASAIDPDAADVWREKERGRMTRARSLTQAWEARGLLRPGLDAGKAADIMWVLSEPDLYRLFVRECGWTATRFEHWLRETLTEQILAEPTIPR